MRKKKKIVKKGVSSSLAGLLVSTLIFTSTVSAFANENSSVEQLQKKTGYQPVQTIEKVVDAPDAVDAQENTQSDEEREIIEHELRSKNSSSGWSVYSSDYYYNQLTTNEKILYDRMEEACIHYMDTTADITNIITSLDGSQYYCLDAVDISDLHLSKTDAMNVLEQFFEVESQFYFLRNINSVSYSSSRNLAEAATITVYDIFSDGEVREQYTQKVMNAINSWVAQIECYQTDYGKQKKAHDLIGQNVTYASNSYDQSIISALLSDDPFDNTTVCTGYAKTFELLCNAVGIDTIITVSNTHAWNVINLYGKWYYVDATWDDDDDNNEVLTYYLDVSSSTLKMLDQLINSNSHVVTLKWKKYLPACTSDYTPTDDDEQMIDRNGLCEGYNGQWYLFVDNEIDTTYTGLVCNDYGWWYVRNGVLDWNYTGVVQNEYGWWYVHNGGLDWNYTGLAQNEYGWWYIKDGAVDWDYTGVTSNEFGWWYVYRGGIDWNYTGVASNEYGWWYIRNGALDWNYTGVASNEYGWWYINNGALDWSYTGLAQNEYGWWYISNGALDWSYTGMAENEAGWWYVSNGAVNFNYTGYATNQYGTWKFMNGSIVF